MGIVNRFLSMDMTEFIAQGNTHIKDFSAGGIILCSPNPVLSRLSAGTSFGYERGNISLGILGLAETERYSDGVTELKGKIIFSTAVKAERFFASTSYGFTEDNFIYYMQTGFQDRNMKLFLQASKENVFVISGGMVFAFDERFKMGILGDTEKRIIYSLEADKNPYRVEYRGMVHTDLPLSNGIYLTLYSGNKYLRLHEIKANKVKFEFGGKIKIEENLEYPIDLNRCSYDDMMNIKDISRQILRRIYVNRLMYGDYIDYSRIDSIAGVGKKTLERIKEQTYIGEENGKDEEE
ncbi:TPA: hypothetical protein DCW38_03975 [candidate division WOR-3 bacterium]|uniref:Helix-hairpin-helix domain-containing protein n=1 Tax=candidate division WOR-3 bacterium TaxID=2052148 RepID=A0A350H9V3_UNCW3|nr:hypothetical protein [candidate division WOR-3 bacterium]